MFSAFKIKINGVWQTILAFKGDTGPQGPQGIQGIQGPKGEDGTIVTASSTGTSTNEINYLTIDSEEYKIAGQPQSYLKSAAASSNTLTLTNKDDSTVVFTPESGEPDAYIKSASTSNNTLTLTNKDNTTVTYTPTTPNASTSTVGGLTVRLSGTSLYIKNDGGEA